MDQIPCIGRQEQGQGMSPISRTHKGKVHEEVIKDQ